MKINKLNEAVYEPAHPKYARDRYRKLTGMEEDEKITEESLQEWAVDDVAVHSNEDKGKVKQWLTEADDDDVTIDSHNKKVASEVGAVAELDADDSKGVIEKTLDRLLKVNKLNQKRGHGHFNNVLFEGNAGTGKTSRIKAWAAENGINLLIKKANELDVSDFGVLTTQGGEGKFANKVRTTEFDLLDRENSVLFLDEYNRAPANVRGTLLTLVNDHIILDPQGEEGVKEFPNFLFTIAAINPFNGMYDTKQLDSAEMSRFRHVNVPNEANVILAYFTKKYNQWIADAEAEGDHETAHEDRGRLSILTCLLSNPNFEFDNEEDELKVMEEGNRLPLNSRSLESLISDCDGTKEDFLNLWDEYVNNFKKPMAQMILKNYKDVDDKANQAIGATGEKRRKGTSAFAGKKSLLDIVNDALDEE
jgi:AAA+ superfamily predicted ATPase